EELKDDIDYVLTFEELAALLDAAEINLENCSDTELNDASYYGRIFARSGGVTEAVNHVIDIKNVDIDFKPVRCNGLKECDKALKLAKFGRLNGNFIEGMACKGGCISGPASLHIGPKDKTEIEKYDKLVSEKSTNSSLDMSKIDIEDINLSRT